MSLIGLLGKKVKKDVMNDFGLVLIPAFTIIEQDHLNILRQHRIHYSEVILMSDSESSTNASIALVKEATRYTKDLFDRIQTQKKIPLLEIKNDLIPIVKQVSEHPNLFQLLEAVKAKDEYTHQHNIGVGVLSTLIGKWLKLDESEIALLSVAATMHDVGKVKVSNEILLKPDKLTDEEFNEMKRHTIYGYEMLKETVGLSHRIALVALQHHERADGRGYPLKLMDLQMDRLSRIVAVADVFHAMSSKRPYHDALPFYEVVSQLRKGFFGELDPHIVDVFLKNMIRNLIGQRVMLTDGNWAEVIYINPHDDTHPLVKIDQNFIDLSKERQIHIREIIA
jgi:HD-GYP domain-containing protein (c-di-GMP phosphodiesterase class II)